jgi:hypothetical protein
VSPDQCILAGCIGLVVAALVFFWPEKKKRTRSEYTLPKPKKRNEMTDVLPTQKRD